MPEYEHEPYIEKEEDKNNNLKLFIIAVWKYYLQSKNDGLSKRHDLINELKKIPLIPNNVLNINVEKNDPSFELAISKTISYFLETHDLSRVIEDAPEVGKPFTQEGYVLLENKFVKIQINDPKQLTEKDFKIRELIAILKDEVQKFRPPIANRFKAIVSVSKEIFTIIMDPGNHKESLSIFLSPNTNIIPNVLNYQHTASGYESSQNLTARMEYVRGAWLKYLFTNRNLESNYVYADQNTKDVNTQLYFSDNRVLGEKFRTILRLCQSVKDLDLYLKDEQVRLAVKLFGAGVTNMQFFLNAFEIPDHYEEMLKMESSNLDQFFSQKEKVILGDFFKL